MMCWSIVKPRENRKKRNVIKLGLLERNSSSFLILYFIFNSLYINLWLYKYIFHNNFPQTWTIDYFLRNWLIPLKITKKKKAAFTNIESYLYIFFQSFTNCSNACYHFFEISANFISHTNFIQIHTENLSIFQNWM